MNKKLLTAIVVILVVIIGGVAVVALTSKDDTKTDTSTASNQDNMANMDTNKDQSQPSKDSSSQNPPSNSNSVTISNYEFSPKNITIKKGTTVTWTNQDSVEHTVTGKGGGGPDSKLLAKGESYSFTFDNVGTFDYFCTPHPYMTGTVTVTE